MEGAGQVPYFVSLPSATKKCLMLHMETVVGTPGDVMLQAGMSSGGLFFVAHGSAKVLFLEEPAVKDESHIVKGWDSCGMACFLWRGPSRHADVTSLTSL
eukprot:gene23914-29017_t